MKYASDRDRILRNVVVDDNGCWLWQGAVTSNGYGKLGRLGRTWSAHRLSYEAFIGAIPDGLTIDHLCRVRHCANPEHLEPVTQRENTFRGTAPPAQNAAKTHCVNGHEFTPENTYRNRGMRTCRACMRLYQSTWAPPHVDAVRAAALRREGLSWYRIAELLETNHTACRAAVRAALGYDPKPPSTTCKNGHDRSLSYWRPDGRIAYCKACRRESRQRSKAAV